MKTLLLVITLSIFSLTVNGQNESSDDCIDHLEKLMEQGETDEALKYISTCKRNYTSNKRISKLYWETIWELKNEYYHSSSDLELFVEFQSIVLDELMQFHGDSTLINLMTQVIVDKSCRYIDIDSMDIGIGEINVFLEDYPKQRNLLKKIVLSVVIKSMEEEEIERASHEIDLLLNSKLAEIDPRELFTQLIEIFLKENDLTSANYLYLLSKQKFPNLFPNLNSIICEHVSELQSSIPSILTIQQLQESEKYFPDCAELMVMEKKHLLAVIESALKDESFSIAGRAFRLAKVNFRNDDAILMLKKQWVLSDFKKNYQTTGVTSEQLKWNGDTSLCLAGTVSEYSHQMVEKRVNYFRRLAGLKDSCSINFELNKLAQEAALIMKANNDLSHFPDVNWKCCTDIGFKGAGDSNISLGEHSTGALTGQMEDEGENNFGVGHRRWILYPSLNEIGHGSTDFSQALLVRNFSNIGYDYTTNFVCWPPEHYIPVELVFRRWSFTLEDADFYDSKIIMTNGNITVPITIEQFENVGAGDNSIVWVPDLTDTNDLKPYLVKITNVYLKGDFRRERPMTFEYWIEIIE